MHEIICIKNISIVIQWKIQPRILFCLIGAIFIYRSLQIHEETGVSHSHWLEEQRGQDGGDGLGGPLRYPDACIFWLQADMEGKEEGFLIHANVSIHIGASVQHETSFSMCLSYFIFFIIFFLSVLPLQP